MRTVSENWLVVLGAVEGDHVVLCTPAPFRCYGYGHDHRVRYLGRVRGIELFAMFHRTIAHRIPTPEWRRLVAAGVEYPPFTPEPLDDGALRGDLLVVGAHEEELRVVPAGRVVGEGRPSPASPRLRTLPLKAPVKDGPPCASPSCNNDPAYPHRITQLNMSQPSPVFCVCCFSPVREYGSYRIAAGASCGILVGVAFWEGA